MQIPKIIHLIEPTEEVFHLWKDLLPDWECYEWTLEQCYHFIAKFYPDFIGTYLSYKSDIQRTRASWVFLLHRYGGVAIDRNMIPRKRITSLFYTPHSFYVIDKKMIASPPKTRHLDEWIEYLSHTKGSLWMKLKGTYIDHTSWVDHYDTSIKVIPERIWTAMFIYYEHTSFFKALGWTPVFLCAVGCVVSYFLFKKKMPKLMEPVLESNEDKSTPMADMTIQVPKDQTIEPVSSRPFSIEKYLGKSYKTSAVEYGSQYHESNQFDTLSDISLSTSSSLGTLSMSRISSLSSLHSTADEIVVSVEDPSNIILQD
jgi:hypothetical protein